MRFILNKTIVFGLTAFCLVACSKALTPTPLPTEPVNTEPFVGRWVYNSTTYIRDFKKVELPDFEVEFLKDFTFVHYQNKKEIRRGKYELLEEYPTDPFEKNNKVPRLKYLDTGEKLYYFYANAKISNRYELYIFVNANTISETYESPYHVFLRENK